MEAPEFIPYSDRFDPKQPPQLAAEMFYRSLCKRRSIRHFSDRAVSRETVEWIVRAAGSAPSGANKQPWRFVCIQDSATKSQIRVAAEAEEREFYEQRAGDQWLADLAPLGTDFNKEYLEIAPWLIVVFKLNQDQNGSQVYYANESVGIAVGMLLAAAHHAGLATLTHTPSPMGFLCDILRRPSSERPFVLIPIGFPADDCRIPIAGTRRKPLDEIMQVV